MSMEERLRDADRAADGRARVFCAELRSRVDRFEREIRLAGIHADERLADELDIFLSDTRAIFDRMDGGVPNVLQLPLPADDFADVIDIGTRRPQLTVDQFDAIRRGEPA